MIYITHESNTVPVKYAKFVREEMTSLILKLSSKGAFIQMGSQSIRCLANYQFLASFFLACTPTLSVKTAVKKKNIWNVLTVKKLSNASSIKSHQNVIQNLSVGNGLSCIRISNNFIVGKDCPAVKL